MESVTQAITPLKERAIVLALWLVLFAVSSQFLLVAPILPRISEQLDVPQALLGTLVTGYAVAVALVALVAGPVSDRYGRRLILRVGSLLMAVVLLMHGLATSYWTLLGLRVLTGCASGLLSGAAIAYVGDVFPYQRRGWALGWAMSGMAYGQILGVPLGTIASDYGGFRAPFMALGVVMVLAFAGTMHVLVEAPVERTAELTVRGGLAKYRALLGQPALVACALASTTMMLSVSSYIVFMPTWLEARFGATSGQIASLFFVGGIANAGMAPVAGRWSDRVGRKRLVMGASLALIFTMGLTPLIPSFNWAYALFFANMMAVGARISPLNAWMTALVSGRDRGTLLSLTMATGQAGFAVGAALAGWTYTHSGYGLNTAIAAGGALVTALILGLLVPEPNAEVEGEAAGR